MNRKLPSKFEIIRQYKTREETLLDAIHLKCGDCMGFFRDPYKPCTSDKCPLRQFYPTKGMARSPKFKKSLLRLAKDYDNPKEILNEISKPKAKFDPERGLKRTKDE